MDFLDPKKQKAHAIRLAIGYVVTALVILLATVILLHQAYGYSIDRHGHVIQNGLVFVSSAPVDADIYANNQKKDSTSARLALAAGQYLFELKRDGYRPWKRAITVEGGTLQRFDYPFLFPTSLETSDLRAYTSMPGFTTQSPDRRWLLVQAPTQDTFDLFDLDQESPVPKTVIVPNEILSASTTTTSWEEIEWAKDNRHVLLRRHFERAGQRANELILFDRDKPAESRNLTVVLGFTPTAIELRDRAYDQYYAFDQLNGTLFTASLEKPTPQPYLNNVLAFESEGSSMLLYATNQDAPADKTLLRLRDGDKDYTLRQVARDAVPFMLKLARYDEDWFVVAGASSENKIYVYKNPQDVLKKTSDAIPTPVHILKVPAANYVDFAPEDRFVVAENGNQFAVYDVKNDKGYGYQLSTTVDNLSGHASWMDGYRLNIFSGDQLVTFDYDGINQQVLLTTAPAHLPYYDPDYRKLYTFNLSAVLTSTHLRTERDR